jgi:hypothetical protein
MNTNDSQPAEARQGDLDDLPGTYTFDDGHAGSYDHEATVSVGDDATVTVTCACGEWERTAFGDAAVLAEWEAHVYQATGRSQATGRPVQIAYLIEDGHWTDDAVAALRERGAEVYPNRSEIRDLRTVDAIVSAPSFMDRVQVMVSNTPRYVRPVWEHATAADYAEAILKAVRDLQADNPAKARPGWCEDGRVDVAAVRAGTPDLADAPAILESLCDEVAELRSAFSKVNYQLKRVEGGSAPVPTVICFDALEAVRGILGGVR